MVIAPFDAGDDLAALLAVRATQTTLTASSSNRNIFDVADKLLNGEPAPDFRKPGVALI